MSRDRTPHTAVYRGKRVKVILKDGRSFIAHFHDRTKTHVFFRDGTKIHKSLIRAFIIYKGE